MTASFSTFLLSRKLVMALNALVILVCVLFAVRVLLPSSQLHVFAKLVSAITPAFTISFFLFPRSQVLASLALVANSLTVGATLVGFYRAGAMTSISEAVLVLLLVEFCLLFVIPLLSALSVLSHWPRKLSANYSLKRTAANRHGVN
jgi:hypothetical protein